MSSKISFIGRLKVNINSLIFILFIFLLFNNISSYTLANKPLIATQNNYSKYWTTGANVGDIRILNVTYCTGFCEFLTPLGSNITTTIIGINDSHITFTREVTFPDTSDSTKKNIDSVPRIGYSLYPQDTASAKSYPLTTNNITYIREFIKNNPSRNISILYDESPFLILHELWWNGESYIDYNVTIDTENGYVIGFSLIVRNWDFSESAQVHQRVIYIGAEPSDQEYIGAEPSDQDFFPLLLGFSILIILGISLSFYYKTNRKSLIKQHSSELPLNKLFKPANIIFLRNLYHKLVLTLSNMRLSAISQENHLNIRELKETDPPSFSVLSNLYPQQIREDMTSAIRGRTVLILTEIAFQPNENSFTNYLSKALNIPSQTVSFELKRLLELDYIQELQTKTTLKDTRYKYYELTQKGTIFLYLLKEIIAYSLMQKHIEID